MAIVVNNPGETRQVDTSGSDAVSWMMAVAVIIILAIGAFYLLPRIARSTPSPQAPGTNVQVTLPGTGGSGSAGTGASGAGGTGATGGSGAVQTQ